MGNLNIGEKGMLFAEIIWKNEPITSKHLTELCEEQLNWKRTTTYTMLKSLCDKGVFQNDKGTVTSVMSREELGALKGEEIVKEDFNGSLPKFLTAFTRKNRLSSKDIDELQKLIDDFKEE